MLHKRQLNLIDDKILHVKSWNLWKKLIGDYWPINFKQWLKLIDDRATGPKQF